MAYFANSSEGEGFDSQCANCEFGERPCPIALVQSLYNYEQFNDKTETSKKILDNLVSNKSGCQMHELIRQELGLSKYVTIRKLTARVNELEAGQGDFFPADKWHKPEEEPEWEGEQILLKFKEGFEIVDGYSFYDIYLNWSDCKDIIAWAYTSDISKPEWVK